MKVKKHVIDNVPPAKLLKEIVEGNNEYMKENKEQFHCLKSGQKPDITLVTCCDSRVSPDVFGVDSLNEVFAIRNIGNQFRNSEGSIKYSLIHLKTPLLIIMGHTGCGAINAALGDYRNEDDSIQEEVVGLTNSIKIAKKLNVDELAGTDDILRNSMYAEINIDRQISKIRSDFYLKDSLSKGDLNIIGMMFDIHCVYEICHAHINITNINGEKDISKIKDHKLLSKLSPEQKENIVRRLVPWT